MSTSTYGTTQMQLDTHTQVTAAKMQVVISSPAKFTWVPITVLIVTGESVHVPTLPWHEGYFCAHIYKSCTVYNGKHCITSFLK